ncbi:MAG TPA: hypothetical protein ENJ43_04525 [Gammaproteobacteria bacterium]|nr:hypothetical protein [Gammaproteobacteria bacterium]
MSRAPSLPGSGRGRGSRMLPVIAVTVLALLAIPLWLNWYSDSVSLPRYCGDPRQTLAYLRQILTEARPAGEESRRPYLIAAKLLFLLPRRSGESVDEYLQRLEGEMRRRCG